MAAAHALAERVLSRYDYSTLSHDFSLLKLATDSTRQPIELDNGAFSLPNTLHTVRTRRARSCPSPRLPADLPCPLRPCPCTAASFVAQPGGHPLSGQYAASQPCQHAFNRRSKVPGPNRTHTQTRTSAHTPAANQPPNTTANTR